LRSDFSPTETDKKPIETIADKLANTAHDRRDHLRKRAFRKLICRLFSFKISLCFLVAKLFQFYDYTKNMENSFAVMNISSKLFLPLHYDSILLVLMIPDFSRLKN
jgi:hypothetical protein